LPRARLVRGTSRAIVNADHINVRQPMKALPNSNRWLALWWLVWGTVLAQQFALHTWGGGDSGWQDNAAFSRASLLLVFVPFGVSMILRWVVLPRISSTVVAFFFFAGGVGLAGGLGLASSFLELPYRQVVFLICLAGIVTYLPLRFGTKAKAPNQSPDPTFASGTSRARHESRHR
jgi:hypothetical protein